MFLKLQRILNFHIRNNIADCILILCGLLCGGIVAAVCVFGIYDLDFKELITYFNDFFESVEETGVNSLEIFKLSVFTNLKLTVLVVMLSMMVIGSVFIPLISALAGYSFCFTLFFLLKAFGVKGILFFLAGVLPHLLIGFPCFLLMLIVSMNFSLSLYKDKGDNKSKIGAYLLKISVIFVLSVPGSLLQGYVEPIIIRLIMPLFAA